MNRRDVEAARDLASEFVAASNELLNTKVRFWSHDDEVLWQETWQVAGKTSGHHRRLSLELTRALAHMRRRHL